MNILHFVTSLDVDLGGPVRAVIDLANALVASGHGVTIVRTDSSPTPPEWLGKTNCPNVIGVGPTGVFGLALSHAVRGSLAAAIQSSDVIHAHGAWSLENVVVCRLATRLRKPYVVSLHGMLDVWPMQQKTLKKRIFLGMVGSKWLAGASQIHLAAQLELEQSKRWLPRGRGEVVPNLLDIAPFRRLPESAIVEPLLQRLRRDRPRVLFLSRLHPKKGLDILLRAAALLRAGNRPVNIIVAGEGTPEYAASMRGLARELNLADDEIVFLGPVTGDRKLALFRSCDVFALPTHHENFGYALVEALACGLCLVTTPQVAIASELRASGGAVIVDAAPEAFAASIADLVANGETLRAKGEQAREWAFGWFDGPQIISRYEQMYSRCVRPGAA